MNPWGLDLEEVKKELVSSTALKWVWSDWGGRSQESGLSLDL